MTPEEMEKTEIMGSIGAAIQTPSGVECTCSSGNRLLDNALVDRRLDVVTVEPCWAVPWKLHVAVKSAFSGHHRRRRELQKEVRNENSKFLWMHEDAELGEASENVGALYHR